jgi:hypothetical protein
VALAAIPPGDEPHPERYVAKVVGLSVLLVVSGAATYAVGRWRARS